ncbi:MAG: tetratricopeptide repeat protein [Candidatus Eisenbacteria bacterium]|nr:tetratricopeptide repeat protein [Candidatus Eisenbacteria bacterium]
MHALVLVYLLFGARFLRGRSGLAAPSAALALVLLGAYVFTTRGTYEKEGALLPLATSSEAPYSIFSRDHLALAGNVLFLLLGGALLLPSLRFSGSARGSSREESPLVRFIGSAALGGVLFLLLVDPRLGSRDWDLLALPVFPLLLLIAAVFVPPSSSLAPSRPVLLLGAMVLHTLPWVVANADRDRAVPMVLATTARDPLYDDPNRRASSALALLFSESGYGDASVLLAERAARAKGGAVDFTNVGKAYAAKGEYEEAIRWFRRALAVDRSHADAEWCLGLALFLKGDRAEAEASLRSFLSLDPKTPDAYDLLGLILGQEGRIREAIDVLERGVSVDSTHVEFWRKLAVLYERENRLEEAIRAASRAVRLHPDDEEARERLADLQRR